MEFTLAKMEYLDQMCEITEQAKAQIRRMGFDQWQKGNPSREGWIRDIEEKHAWAAVENDEVLSLFTFFTTPDPSYGVIDGAWLTGDEADYASMHRVCVSDKCKGQGMAGKMFAKVFELAREHGLGSVRIDTHPENLPMQRALAKAGFVYCGEIYLSGGAEDGDLRIAFEKVLE